MRTRTTAAAATLLLAALTACQNSDEPAAGGDKASKTKAPAATKKSASPSPSEDKPRDFGEAITFNDPATAATIKTTVLGYEQGIKAQTAADQEFNTSGYEWAALEIKVCITKGTGGTTRYPWTLAYEDGARIEPSSVTYGDFPKPEYPYEATVKAGDCVRGKTVFPVPGNQRPERVLYTPDALPEGAEWRVPKV
ncbi:hypothetical protein [Streptomyces sp. NBC_01092]|uniref:hypothetical protein n=1 Tax=Streptomyces sp. NBC_01092 TaxID=2903748 RepID=UPI0038641543|nr:hypothetical protein OG254_22130 [Streptomyces sp. NBC_01092]